jgi:hypothetical protein
MLRSILERCKHVWRVDLENVQMTWAWRKTAWEVALCVESWGFDTRPPHGAFLSGALVRVIVRLAK